MTKDPRLSGPAVLRRKTSFESRCVRILCFNKMTVGALYVNRVVQEGSTEAG
jgi:hypothetical protein